MSKRIMLSAYDWTTDGKVQCRRLSKTDLTFDFGLTTFFLHMEESTFEAMLKAYADFKIAEAKEAQIEPAQRSIGSSTEIPRSESSKGLNDECEPSGDPKYRIGDHEATVRAAINGADIDKRCA